MLGFLERWKAKRKIKEAREEAKKNPTPKTTAHLADVFLEYNEFDSALAVLEMGIKAFPDSEILQQKYRKVKRLKYRDQIRQLTQVIENNPDPTAFAKLADIYAKIGEEDKAIEIGQRGVEVFPNYEGNHLILGKLRWDRYRNNLIAKDGVKAVEHFEQAVRLNPNNTKILYQLARIYVEIGAKKKATEKLTQILQTYPQDANARSLLQRAQSLPDRRESDLEELFQEFQKRHPGLKRQPTTKAADIANRMLSDPSFLKQKIESLVKIPELQGLVIIREDNQVLFSHYANPSWKQEAEPLLLRAVQAAKDCSLKMDIGAFQDGRIEGPDGWILMRGFVQLLFVFLFSHKVKFKQIEDRLSDFFEFSIYV